MHKWIIRFMLSILSVVIIHLFVFGYILYQVLSISRSDTTDGLYTLFGGTFILLITLSAFIYQIIYKNVKPIEEITNMLKDLTQGHFWRRVSLQHETLYDLSLYTNQLAQKMKESTEYQYMNEERLQALIRQMASGLLFIDQKGKIVLSNHKLLSMLQWDDSMQNKLYYEAPLPDDIVQIIQNTFFTEKESKHQVTIETGIERLEVKLYVAPVKDHQEKVSGIVLVFYDITDLKNLEQMRKDFVANVSHELKTPLTSIKGFSETLLDGAMYSEEHLKQFLEIIRQESDRLHRLIQELVDLSHIEQRRFQLNWGAVNLNEIVKDTLMLVQTKADQKEISLIFKEGEKEAHIEADSDRIRQILLNLVSNAIQYTPNHGEVTIKIEAWKEEGYTICIQDNGVGIPKEEIARIFERFYRVDKARSRSSGGTGLGLAIVKHLVEAHHGHLSVTSEEGKGSQFCVSFYSKNPSSNIS